MSALVLGHPKIPAPLRASMVDGADPTSPASDNLEEAYRAQITAAMEKEAQRRVTESHDPEEISRLEALC